jgi:hypothetical protein
LSRAQVPAFTLFADGVRLRMKVTKRRAHGLLTFNGFPARMLLPCA